METFWGDLLKQVGPFIGPTIIALLMYLTTYLTRQMNELKAGQADAKAERAAVKMALEKSHSDLVETVKNGPANTLARKVLTAEELHQTVKPAAVSDGGNGETATSPPIEG